VSLWMIPGLVRMPFKFCRLEGPIESAKMPAQLNSSQLLEPIRIPELAYLSCKTLGAFSNWQAVTRINRHGPNPSEGTVERRSAGARINVTSEEQRPTSAKGGTDRG